VPPERWLILADDLTGAADTAIAFARSGWMASVAWGDECVDDAVLALDAGSRGLDAGSAAARHGMLMRAHLGGRSALFKKIDSTLRGQPAAELAATLQALRRQGQRGLAVVAPAFPATGRTTEDGCIRLHGQALEETSLWAREHSYSTADLRAVLAGEGLAVRHAPLDAVRAGPCVMTRMTVTAAEAGADALVCDATEEADLAIIARVAAPRGVRLLWVGAAGLARALAEASPGTAAPSGIRPRVEGGILVVVGSLAEVSRQGVACLAADHSVLPLTVAPAMLLSGPDDAAWRATADLAARTIAARRDVLVAITADHGAAPVEKLALGLAALLRPAAARAGGVIATGGETARALCDACGVTGIRMLAELEPGVPLGLAQGGRALPIVTKAGAFGDAGTLGRCLAYLRGLRDPKGPS